MDTEALKFARSIFLLVCAVAMFYSWSFGVLRVILQGSDVSAEITTVHERLGSNRFGSLIPYREYSIRTEEKHRYIKVNRKVKPDDTLEIRVFPEVRNAYIVYGDGIYGYRYIGLLVANVALFLAGFGAFIEKYKPNKRL